MQRARRSDAGTVKAIHCASCKYHGIETTCHTFESLARHKDDHAANKVKLKCKVCKEEMIIPLQGRVKHVCTGRPGKRSVKRVRDSEYVFEEDGSSLIDESEEREAPTLCPTCGENISGMSVSSQMNHISTCDGDVGRDNVVEPDNAIDERVDDTPLPEQVSWNLISNPPTWANKIFLSRKPDEVCKTGDAMLMSVLEYGGQVVSCSTKSKLWELLNTKDFVQAVLSDQLSRSYYMAKKQQVEAFKSRWNRVVVGDLCFFCRDLSDVVCEIVEDDALIKDADFTGDTPEPERPGEIVWGDRWTQFPAYQQRRKWMKKRFSQNNCDCLSVMLWTDSGETSRGRTRRANPIALLCMVPLNVSPSFARRKDCIFPIAFYNATDKRLTISLVLTYLLPQFEALRKGFVFNHRVNKSMCVTIDGLCGDHPALASVLGTLSSASSRHPCKLCLAEQHETSFINSETNLHLKTRTLKDLDEAIVQNKDLTDEEFQKKFGIRAEFRSRPHPMWQYFKNDGDICMFTRVLLDKLHDVYLGILKACFRTMARLVLERPEDSRMFRDALVHLDQVRGVDATLVRPKDFKESCETTLLHLLVGGHGSLMAREVQAISSVLLVVFDACENDTIRRAIRPMSELVQFCAALESRYWPVKNDTDNWWKGLKAFGIDAYKDFQKEMGSHLPKENKLIKVHNVLAHAVDIRRLHGPVGDVQSLEGLFGIIKSVPTNRKNPETQVIQNLEERREAGRRLQTMESLSVARNIVHKDHTTKESATCVSEELDEIGKRFCISNGLILLRWVQRLPLSVQQLDSGMDRGVPCLFASSKWHGSPKYDVVEQDNKYLMLQALAVAAAKDGKDVIIGVGFELIQHDPRLSNASDRIGYRMPILRKRRDHELSCKILKPDELAVACLIPHLRRMDRKFQKQLEAESGEKYMSEDVVYHHNIFITRGPYRYPHDYMWFPIHEH